MTELNYLKNPSIFVGGGTFWMNKGEWAKVHEGDIKKGNKSKHAVMHIFHRVFNIR